MWIEEAGTDGAPSEDNLEPPSIHSAGTIVDIATCVNDTFGTISVSRFCKSSPNLPRPIPHLLSPLRPNLVLRLLFLPVGLPRVRPEPRR